MASTIPDWVGPFITKAVEEGVIQILNNPEIQKRQAEKYNRKINYSNTQSAKSNSKINYSNTQSSISNSKRATKQNVASAAIAITDSGTTDTLIKQSDERLGIVLRPSWCGK